MRPLLKRATRTSPFSRDHLPRLAYRPSRAISSRVRSRSSPRRLKIAGASGAHTTGHNELQTGTYRSVFAQTVESARRLGSAVGRGGYARATKNHCLRELPSVTVAVSPSRPGHAVTVEYRVNGGPVRQAMACPCRALNNRTRACFARSCQGNQAGWSISCRCSASPASRSRPVYRVG